MSWTVEIESEVESLVSADRMFKAAILDWHNLGPEILPDIFVSATIEGNVRQFNFTSVMPFSFVKERLDFVDHETFECKSTITEGGHLGTRLDSASVTYKIVDTHAGDGCIVMVVTTCEPLPGIELDDEASETIDKAKEAVVKHFKAVEAYLLANPDMYYDPPTLPLDKLNVEDIEVDDDEMVIDSHPRDFKTKNIMIQKVVGNSMIHAGTVHRPARTTYTTHTTRTTHTTGRQITRTTHTTKTTYSPLSSGSTTITTHKSSTTHRR